MSLLHRFVIVFLPRLWLFLLPSLAAAEGPMALKDVKTWMIQTQKLESRAAIVKLAQTSYDMIVIDTMSTVKPTAKVDMHLVVKKLHEAKPGRLVLVYLDLAEAESYRTYWQHDWKAPTKKSHGNPDFIIMPDPSGWDDNYLVEFWDKRWQALVLGDNAIVKHLMDEGYDGVYLDWVQAYKQPEIADLAKQQGVDSAKAMVDFISSVRAQCQKINPRSVIIAQNGAFLIDADPRFKDVIDGICFEATWFDGKANVDWGDKRGGDIANMEVGAHEPVNLVKQYEKYREAGKIVFTVDYCLDPKNAAKVYELSLKHGFVPLVTQVSVENVTETPPPVLKH